MLEFEIPSEVKDEVYLAEEVSTIILGPFEHTGFDAESTEVLATGYLRVRSTSKGIVSVECSADLVLALGTNTRIFVDDPLWKQRLMDMFENTYPLSGKTDGWLSDVGDWFVRNFWGDREHGPCNDHPAMNFRLYWYDHWLWGEHSYNTEPCPN
ncbi:hypothetical protein [Phaeocystidibacter luteus]|uniref:Uncharacterized protein n=1 Tax=Phaeocystidibacter luteus TaxID=911197 RepID=A0A6N6RI59_9FLAO|nr:hypothetical protein [Phaeocystidibacter luteus]KAB2814002.1 hypothetical protein F8C67_04795 [Phaeocystidibacter luteus]